MKYIGTGMVYLSLSAVIIFAMYWNWPWIAAFGILFVLSYTQND